MNTIIVWLLIGMGNANTGGKPYVVSAWIGDGDQCQRALKDMSEIKHIPGTGWDGLKCVKAKMVEPQ